MIRSVISSSWSHPSSSVPLLRCRSSQLFPILTRSDQRYFFSFGSSNDNNSDNGNSNDGKSKKNGNKTESSGEKVEDKAEESKSTKTTDTSPLTPTRLGFGDEAPRYPHVLALPVISRPLFPGVITNVTLTDPVTIDALENLSRNNPKGYLATFLRKKHPGGVLEGGIIVPSPEIITSAADLHNVGTFVQIYRLTRGVGSAKPPNPLIPPDQDDDDSAASVLLLAHRRVDLISIDELGPPVDATVKHWERVDYSGSDDTIRALSNEILSTIRELAQSNPLFRESVQFFPIKIDSNDPFRLADFAASIASSGTPEDLQAVLEEKDPEIRLSKALVLLSREREVSKLQQEISSKVEEKLTDAQRKYFLTEQLKAIKKELGMEKDDKEALIAKFRKQLAKYPSIPAEASETIEAELEKFSTLEKNSPEYNVTRNYLDWLVGIPWGVTTDENFDIVKARRVLDRDHYGLDDVKDTILQFIAIGKLKGTVQGKILCLAGPPGTGKTSIATSIADALGRKFYRFSVGGLSDVSEIKGHRRTYIGAMPGKLIQCLKTTETTNPVVLIDEIDKLGMGFRGDPASALLEVLDPNQNSTFRDHFLDVPVDISKALFICTANELDRIPSPLLDRMEVIRLSGYDFPEKVAIAEQYLVPKSLKDSGLMVEKETEQKEGEPENNTETERVVTPLDSYKHAETVPDSLLISSDAVESLVRWYCREAGVRSLAKHIDRITRKLALQVVAEQEGTSLKGKSSRKSETWEVTSKNLSDYVGKPIFISDRLYEKDPLPEGIVMGLAYTSLGGSALYIETQGIKRALDADGKRRGGGTLKVTGQLGDVMKESTQIAYTVARARLAAVDPKNSYFDENDIHTHVPEGATPKDGPSAGITMVTSMLSLALDRPVKNDLAMTGEVSLTGKVLAVGGIKEKIMAARRAGIKSIIMPSANQRDFDEIPDYLKDGLEVHYADDYDKVFEVAFGAAS